MCWHPSNCSSHSSISAGGMVFVFTELDALGESNTSDVLCHELHVRCEYQDLCPVPLSILHGYSSYCYCLGLDHTHSHPSPSPSHIMGFPSTTRYPGQHEHSKLPSVLVQICSHISVSTHSSRSAWGQIHIIHICVGRVCTS